MYFSTYLSKIQAVTPTEQYDNYKLTNEDIHLMFNPQIH